MLCSRAFSPAWHVNRGSGSWLDWVRNLRERLIDTSTIAQPQQNLRLKALWYELCCMNGLEGKYNGVYTSTRTLGGPGLFYITIELITPAGNVGVPPRKGRTQGKEWNSPHGQIRRTDEDGSGQTKCWWCTAALHRSNGRVSCDDRTRWREDIIGILHFHQRGGGGTRPARNLISDKLDRLPHHILIVLMRELLDRLLGSEPVA